MGLLMGMDEAGYGPNLGPLVVSVTAWEVDGAPARVDLWKQFDGVVSRELNAESDCIVLGDSKELYSPAVGLARLESSVLAVLACIGHRPRSFTDLLAVLNVPPLDEPWFDRADVELPVAGCRPSEATIERWCRCTRSRLTTIRSDVVLTERFNTLTRQHNSKGQALSEISMRLVRSVWPAEVTQPILVQCDKHGGRNRYHDLLTLVVEDAFIEGLRESTASSRYRVRTAEFRFEVQSERFLPVALASMVSKYVRELSMLLFNRYWAAHIPDLKPTAGYPGDSRRFRNDITERQRALGIPDDVLWRHR